MRILGLDPGLRRTGWGLIRAEGARLTWLADGCLASADGAALPSRLAELYDALAELIDAHAPDAAAVEETFVNQNPTSTLKLGTARGVVLLAPARAGLPVAEYPANLVKKSVVGAGHASKTQMGMMVRTLLPAAEARSEDAVDALAVAICHAHHRSTRAAIGGRLAGAAR